METVVSSAELSTNGFNPPFPALTAAQRWHVEVHGYVVVENVFTADEVGRLYEALHRLKHDFFAHEDPWSARIRNCHIYGNNLVGNHIHFDHLIEASPELFEYATNPRVVGMAEEVVGNAVRITETQAAINSRTKGDTYDGIGRHLWHRSRLDRLVYHDNGLYHCMFVKAITNLTDLGPDDGGTCVIAGSHKVSAAEEGVVKAVREDPSLVHQVIAPAGSTLIFCETLLHATGDIRSDKERSIIITGYMPWDRRTGDAKEYAPEFVEETPEYLHRLVFGSDLNARLRRRTLEMEVGTADPGDFLDGWSLETSDPTVYDIGGVTPPKEMRT
jgi:ectoine hydroxylase-related dioxygenase (phytanoyl-CoA dioxygenase family)